MSIRPHESNKDTATKLAKLIDSGSKDERQITELKQKLGLLENDAHRQAPYHAYDEAEDPEDEERVGIWKPRLINGQEFYVRDSRYVNEFPGWAKVQRIPPKSDKLRICFLGESAARGFLYDPGYTPAAVLENILNLNSDPDVSKSEVIDFARNNCNMKELRKIFSSCFALNPDAIVIFAGNNWQMDIVLSDDDCREMIKVIERKTGFKDLKKILEKKYIDLTANFMKYIADLSKAHNIPVVFIIPEYNVLGWRSNEIEKRLLFPDEESTKWFQLKMEAGQAMAQGDMGKVESLSEEMIALNETNPYPYELLAQCKLKNNLFKDAVKYLRSAHDTTIFQLTHCSGIISITRETLLESANRYDIPVVDLRGLFNKYDEGIQPGNNLFLDHCHLSAEGIKIAMTQTAKCLLSRITGRDIALNESKIREIAPGNDVSGNAHFFAAIYNAHWGRSYEIVYYHCLKALESSKTIEKAMINYTSMASSHIHWTISKDFEEIADMGILSHYYLTQPQGKEGMDIILVEAMTQALHTVGIDIKDKIDRLRKEKYGFINGKIDLLESYYHRTGTMPILKEANYYYQAFDIQSRFFLVTGNEHQISLNLACRVPIKNPGEQRLKLMVNKELISHLSVQEKWVTHTVKIPGEVLIDGINIIVIQWPVVNWRRNPGRNEYQSSFDFLMRRMKPVFGEIHMFRALKGFREIGSIKR